jgi:hypothetical protein
MTLSSRTLETDDNENNGDDDDDDGNDDTKQNKERLDSNKVYFDVCMHQFTCECMLLSHHYQPQRIYSLK